MAVNNMVAVNLLPVLDDGLPASVKRRPKTISVSSNIICPVPDGTIYKNALIIPAKSTNLIFPQPQYFSKTK